MSALSAPHPAAETDDNAGLNKTIILPSLRQLDEEQIKTIRHSETPDDTLLGIILENIKYEFNTLKIDNDQEQQAGNPDLLQEIKEVAKAVFARGKRGEETAKGRYEFAVLADNCTPRRKVTVDISLTEIRLMAKGVAAINGKNGLLKEIGEYIKHVRPKNITDKDTVNHYITGKFAPARKDEALVLVDNSFVNGENGIDCLGHPIRPRPGIPRQIKFGKGVRKEMLSPTKFQLIANRTGIIEPVYDKHGSLRNIDVRESVQVNEVGLREGGHVAIKGIDGLASELDVEDTSVDSVGRAFKIRTSGQVNVKETIYGEVLAENVNALMINAEGKLIAARDTLKVRNALQTSTIRAKNIIIGSSNNKGSAINSTCRARQSLTATNIKFLGRITIILGNDIARENNTVISGVDLFADRLRIANEQRALQKQVDTLVEEIREGLAQQVKKQKKTASQDYRTLLNTIAACEQAYSGCPEEYEDRMRIKLNNALADLGTLDTMAFLNRFAAKKKLMRQLKETAAQLEAISPPLAISLQSISINDGAQIIIRCWRDTLTITRIEQEIIISREKPEEKLFHGKLKEFTITLSFDYQTGKLICSQPS